MDVLNKLNELFLSVWKQGILGVDFFQIIVGLGIFVLFLIFRGLISKLVIKKLELISKKTTNKLDLLTELFSVDGKNRYFIKKSLQKDNIESTSRMVGEELKLKSKGSYKN